MFRVVSAHTTRSNTPETDKLAQVMHTVNIRFPDQQQDMTYQLMASDPLDAMDRVRKIDADYLRKMARPEQ